MLAHVVKAGTHKMTSNTTSPDGRRRRNGLKNVGYKNGRSSAQHTETKMNMLARLEARAHTCCFVDQGLSFPERIPKPGPPGAPTAR